MTQSTFIPQNKATQYAITGLVILAVIGIIYAVGKGYFKLGEFVGIFDTAEEKQAKQATQTAVKSLEQEAVKAGVTNARSLAQMTLEANALYEALRYSAVSDDKTKAYFIMARIQNDLEAARIVQAFGQRQEYAFGLPVGRPMDLKTFVNSNLRQSDINDLNALYVRGKMTFRL